MFPIARERGRVLEPGDKVRFAEKYLADLAEPEARRLRGRVGVVHGYRMGANEPIVDFPAAGRFKALRLFEVALSRLEVIERKATTGSVSTQ